MRAPWISLFLVCFCPILLLSSTYIDNDLDGVNDSIDQCLHTPFDVLVNEVGCAQTTQTHGKVTLQAGATYNHGSTYDDTTLLNLYLGYQRGAWDASLSSTNYNTGLESIVDQEDDLFLTMGYTLYAQDFETRLSVGTKFAFMKDGGISRDNDYYAGLNLTYTLNQQQDMFFYYSYTLSSNTATTKYNNFHTLSLGTGYTVMPKWYTALAYNYISAYYENGESYQTLSWYNTYMITEHSYVLLNYSYGLTKESYDHTVTLSIGVTFE